MASWFTRALDKVTPWDRGGEVLRRKKKEEEDQARNNASRGGRSSLSVSVARPRQNVVSDGQEKPLPEPQRPENLFRDLNQSLNIGRPRNVIDVVKDQNAQVTPQPKPGEVVRPTLKVTTGPEEDLHLPDGRNIRAVPSTPQQLVEKGLNEGKSWEDISRENRLDLKGVKEYSESTRPNYGITVKKPNQSPVDRFRDIFDANTEADKFRRQEGNRRRGEDTPLTTVNPGNIVSRTPIVGTVTKMLNTAARQIPQAAFTTAQSLATREYTEALKSGDKNRIREAQSRLDMINRDVEASNSMFEKNSGGLFNTGTLYDEEGARRGDIKTGLTDIALPTAVAGLDLYTLGRGSAISDAIAQNGLKQGVRVATPDIVKASTGNFFSGAGSTVSEGGNVEQAVKSGLINSILGLAPDVLLPALGKSIKNKVIPKFFTGSKVGAQDVVGELDDAALSAGAETAIQATRPRPIRVQTPQSIPIKVGEGVAEPVPVRTPTPRRGPLIKELEGDFNFPPAEELQKIRIDETRKAAETVNSAARPDPSVEGITPRTTEPYQMNATTAKNTQDSLIDEYAAFLKDVGEGNGVSITPDGRRISNNMRFGDTKAKRMTKADWRDEAERQLKAGQADPELQKAFNEATDPEVQSLLAKGEQPDVPQGRPITVKESKSIPVRDETVVPQNLPETPGKVRVTEQTSPMAAKTEVVASTPTPLPKEVQAVLDNPKQYNKRQVAAARNQRKLARQMAKTQEDTASAMERIEASNPRRVAGQSEGYAPTGQFAEGKKGNAYEKASRETEKVAGDKEMASRSVDDLIDEIGAKESFTPGDRRRIQSALENVAKANPDDTETRLILKKLQSKSRTELAQGLAMWPRVVRRSSTSDALTNRWESKVAKALDDPSKMTDADFAKVQRANDDFTRARDRAEQLNEQFKKTGSEADYKAWEEAYSAARKADEGARLAEVSVAKRVLKGEKGAHVNKVLDSLKKESSVNTMDLVTANMLSGTATGFRNTFGTELAGIENRLFANTRAKITNKLFDENVGGYSRKGARLGRKVGLVKFGRDSARRAEIGGKNPLEWAKNWATTINSGGESSLQSQVYSRLGKYYQNQLKEQGLSGKDLDMRMRHSMLTDPDNMGEIYLDSAMKSSGLTGLFEKGQTIEKAVTDYVGRQTDNKMLQGGSKLLMRLAVGFPTATTNFLYQSAKRLTLGMPSYLETGVKISKGDKMGAAQAFDRALKETGSGTAILGLGVALGSQDLISGPYPDDKDERARWEREGISENSIKIGGAWYPIPQGAGMLGLPLMTGAAIGRGGGDGLKEMYSPGNLTKLLPTDQIQGFLNMASGDGSPQDFKNFAASSVRAVTPVGALFNQIAKSFDDTKNDTTTKDLWHNIIDQVASGIPGVNNAMDIPDKTDDAGNPIKNPNPLQLAFGATSASQQKGVERSGEIEGKLAEAVKGVDQYGLLDDPNMEGVLEDKGLEAYTKLKTGKKLDESDVKALKNGLVKGVSSEGTDTAYLERGEYDTNLAVLKLKKDLMKEDKTTKPSSLKDIDVAIKRGGVYKDRKIPYETISEYKSVSVEEWRKLGDPESDDYDPEMYQKLWDIDQAMTKAGVSYKKGSLDKAKYYQKESKAKGSGRGSRGGSANFGTDFGKLKSGEFAPKVQSYDSVDQKSGSVPVIRRVRPNIVHKISSS